jgi:protein-disulfide isomerase
VIGVAIVVFVASQQLGGRVSGTFVDPGIDYPAQLIDGKTVGRPDAPVTLEVWEDFQCPICARHSLQVEPVIVAKYVTNGTLRIVHHDLAFLGRGGADDESVLAASGAVCATKQGKYWNYSHWVYANQDGENAGGFRADRLQAIAEAAGVDTSDWDACTTDPAVRQEVTDSTSTGMAQGVNATPTMFINGTMVTPAGLKTVDQLSALIDEAAAAAGASSGSPAPGDSATP